MTTDISEKGLETIIMRHVTGTDGFAVPPNTVAGRWRHTAVPATPLAVRRTTTAPTPWMCHCSSPS